MENTINSSAVSTRSGLKTPWEREYKINKASEYLLLWSLHIQCVLGSHFFSLCRVIMCSISCVDIQRSGTCRCCCHDIPFGIPGDERDSSSIMSIPSIKISFCSRYAALCRFSDCWVHIKNHSNSYNHLPHCHLLTPQNDQEKAKKTAEALLLCHSHEDCCWWQLRVCLVFV